MLTMTDINRAQKHLSKISSIVVKQTMKDKNMGLQDAYEKCKRDYMKKYGTEFPKPY
jgi:hypothetical protein